MSPSLPFIDPFANGDTPDARSGQGGPAVPDVDLRRQAVIRFTNSPVEPLFSPPVFLSISLLWYIILAYQSPWHGLGTPWAQMPNLASRNHSGY